MLKHAFKILLLMAALGANFDAQATKTFYVLTVNFNTQTYDLDPGLFPTGICANDSLFISLIKNTGVLFTTEEATHIRWTLAGYESNGIDVYISRTLFGSSIVFDGGLKANTLFNIQIDSLDNTNAVINSINTDVVINKIYTSPSLYLGSDLSSCPGTSASIKNLTVTSGNYLWNTLATTSGINTNSPGTFTVTVTSTDAGANRSCYAMDAIKFAHYPQPEIQIDAINGVRYRCFNEDLQLNVSVINPQATPVSWAWLPVSRLNNAGTRNPILLNNSINSLFYTVTGTDVNGCKASSSVEIRQNAELKATINQPDVTLCKFVSIPLPLNIDKPGGGSTASDYKYKWSPSIGLSNDSIKSPSVSAISVAGISYIVTVTDLNFCTAKDTVIITRSTFEMNFTNPIEEVKTICSGEVISNLRINRNAGIGPFTFNWQPLSVLNKVNDSLYNSKPITQSQKILVTVTDNNGCTDKDSITVTIKPLPASELPNGENTICAGSEKQIAVIAESESLNYNIYWSPNLRISSTNSYKPTFTGDATESATPQLYVVTVTSKENNCSLVDSLRLVTKPFTAFTIEEPSDNIVETESSFKGSVNELQYQWLVTTIGGTPIAPQPSITNLPTLTYKFTSTGFYTLSASGTNSFGCSQIVTKEIEILNPSTKILYVPTIFSPAAANNCNKALYVFCTKTDIVSGSFKLTVFTPTGQKIFESTDLDKMAVENVNNCTDVSSEKGWSGDDYPTGVYSMVVECKFNNKDKTAYKKANPVTLLR